MNYIQDHNFSNFMKYINSTGNTICGRHVLSIFLKIIEHSKLKLKTKFVKYAQS
jgi:MEMO1 family protein